jgi:lipopolysaccharide heptosyltransferase I
MPPMIELPDAPRILLVRLSAIGDAIHTLPLLCALRDRFPRASITWVVEERAAALLRNHAALDELVELPRGWLKSPGRVWQLRRQLRGRFDLAIDAQGLTKSAVVAWLAGTRQRIGFGTPWGRELSRWLNNQLVDTVRPHAVDRHLELLRPLGIESPAVRFDVPETEIDRTAAEEVVDSHLRRAPGVSPGIVETLSDTIPGLTPGARQEISAFAVIAPGAGWPSKVWPAERFAAVAAYLGNRRQLPTLVISGNEQERTWAAQIAAGSGGHARPAPAMSLTGVAALIRRARLFVGSDTGPLHLAAAVGTPCVALYGPWPAEKHGPYGPRHIAIQKLRFAGTTRQRRRASSIYMEAIDVESVCAACDQILSGRRTEAA